MTTAGEKLKAARLEKGLKLEDVAKNTKIKVAFLEYIEKGEYQKLPSVSYAQGFVKNYIKFLGIDEEQTLALFRREFSGEKNFRVLPKGFERQQEFPVNRFKLRSTVFLLIAVFILFFGYILFQYRGAFINPTLVITSPKQNSQIFSSQLKIEGKTDPDAVIYVDKNEVTVDQSGNFSKTINVFPGFTIIDIKSINKFQRQTEKKVEVNIKGS